MNHGLAKALSAIVLDNDVQGLRVITEIGELEVPISEIWIKDGTVYISVRIKLP